MQVTTKDVVGTKEQAEELELPVGTHILTSVIEGDGAVELASKDAKLNTRVISVSRTDSGGVQVQVALFIEEPKPQQAAAPAAGPTREDQALDYLKSKGIKNAEAKDDLAKFGADRILEARDHEAEESKKALDAQLADKLFGR